MELNLKFEFKLNLKTQFKWVQKSMVIALFVVATQKTLLFIQAILF